MLSGNWIQNRATIALTRASLFVGKKLLLLGFLWLMSGTLVFVTKGRVEVLAQSQEKVEPDQAPEASDSSESPKEERVYRVVLISNGSGKVGLVGGRSVPLKPLRTLVLLKEGWHDLQVSGQGYLDQMYRVFVDEKSSVEPIFLAMRKVEVQAEERKLPLELPEWTSEMSQRVRVPSQMPSGCAKLNLTIPPTQRRYSLCLFSNLIQEIFRVGPLLRELAPKESSAAHYTSMQFHRALAGLRSSKLLTNLAETLHRITWKGSLGFEAASLAALLAGDCQRVSQLWHELFTWGRSSAVLTTHLSVCYESVGDQKTALEILNYGQNSLPPTEPELAAILYHLARLQMNSKVASAEATLQRCTEVFPWLRSCFHRQADVAIARGNHQQQKSILAVADQALGDELSGVLDQTITYVTEGKHKQAKAALSSLRFEKISFSAQFLRAYLYRKNLALRGASPAAHPRRVPAHQVRVMHFDQATKVVDLLEGSPYPDLYEMALHTMIRERTDERSLYVSKITDHYYQHGRCAQILFMRLPEFTGNDPEHYILAMDRRVQCLLKTKKLDAAEVTLRVMQKVLPGGWLARYRLGELYLLKNEKFLALKYYRGARQVAPPEDKVVEINQKIADIEASMNVY